MLAQPAPRAAGRVRASQEPQVFRSGASGVAVDVSVRDRNRRPITGLKAEDFEVLDNGVPQQVEEISYAKRPIDVTVALDISHSVTGVMLERLRRGVTDLMGDLGRDDRLKLVLFNLRIMRTVDFTTDTKLVGNAIKSATPGGGTALLDTIAVAAASPTASDRRHLVVIFTDGADSSSITSPAALAITAQRSRATLAFVLPATSVPAVMTTSTGLTSSTIIRGQSFMTPPRPFESLFQDLARDTGGQIVPAAANADLSSTFRQVLDAFRSAYVLLYNARGVERGGYHTLDVKVKREGAVVTARRGYFQ
jgi:VWFA-related protein